MTDTDSSDKKTTPGDKPVSSSFSLREKMTGTDSSDKKTTPGDKPVSSSFSFRKNVKIVLLLFIVLLLGVVAYTVWGWITETSRTKEKLQKAQAHLDAMKQSYNTTLTKFQSVVKKTTLSYIQVGPRTDGMSLTVRLRTMNGLGERVVEPTIARTSTEAYCYQKTGNGPCRKVAFTDKDATQDCYACVPPMNILDGAGTKLVSSIDGWQDKETGLLYVRRIKIEDASGNTTTFQFEKALEEIATQTILNGSDVINPSVSVDSLSENTTYKLVTNQAGKYTLEKVDNKELEGPIGQERPMFIDTATVEEGIVYTRAELNSADKWI